MAVGDGSGTDDLVLSYRYTSSGQRYWTDECAGQADCEAEYYVLDGAETVGVFTASGALTYWNASGAGRHLADGSRRYYLTDHLGSVRTVVDGTGSPVEARDYYPYGLELPGRTVQASPPTKEGFTGHEKDGATGLVYAGARYYMPAVPRWTAVDPILTAMPPLDLLQKDYRLVSLSPYNYAFSNPMQFIDPNGMTPAEVSDGCPPICGGQPLSIGEQLYYAFGGPILDELFGRAESTADAVQQVGGATQDFVDNYDDMREANTIGADKYFHCKANCEATQRGDHGEEAAKTISDVREFVDKNVKGDSEEASEADQVANRHGREEAHTGGCRDVCDTFRPNELDEEY